MKFTFCVLHSDQETEREIDGFLRELSDFKVDFDHVLVSGSFVGSDQQLNDRLLVLTMAMTEFRNCVEARKDELRDEIQLHERNGRQADDIRQNVEDLKKWFDDSRKLTFAAATLDETPPKFFSELQFQEVNYLYC